MTTPNHSRVIPRHPGKRRSERQTMVPVKMTEAERARFKVACAEDGNISYADFIVNALDERDAKAVIRAAKQVHPFHRPGEQ